MENNWNCMDMDEPNQSYFAAMFRSDDEAIHSRSENGIALYHAFQKSLEFEMNEITMAMRVLVRMEEAVLLRKWQIRSLKKILNCHFEHFVHYCKMLMTVAVSKDSHEKDDVLAHEQQHCHEKALQAMEEIQSTVSRSRIVSSAMDISLKWKSYRTVVFSLMDEQSKSWVRASVLESNCNATVMHPNQEDLRTLIKNGPPVVVGSMIHFMGTNRFREVFMKEYGFPTIGWYTSLQPKHRLFAKQFLRPVELLQKEPLDVESTSIFYTGLALLAKAADVLYALEE